MKFFNLKIFFRLDGDHVVVKITDFGLCRTSNIDYEYISENHFQQLPFRWTAIECFGNNSKVIFLTLK